MNKGICYNLVDSMSPVNNSDKKTDERVFPSGMWLFVWLFEEE